jgi:hypothetical protein
MFSDFAFWGSILRFDYNNQSVCQTFAKIMLKANKTGVSQKHF